MGNRISGLIPSSIEYLSYLKELHLSQNNLKGIIPEGWGQCRALVRIDLSSNLLEGSVSDSHLANLSRLDYLDLSFNNLDLNLSSNWTPPFQLKELHMVSCKIQSNFPQWLRRQTNLSVLDLSDNMMSGELLDYFPSTVLSELNACHNHIIGQIPYFSFTTLLSSVDLSYNFIYGPLLHPSAKKVENSLCDLPSLGFLHFHKNKLSDCLGNSTSYTETINLSYNEFEGIIPPQLCTLPVLQFLDLADNKLIGNIPHCLGHIAGTESPVNIPFVHRGQYIKEFEIPVENTMVVLKGEKLEYTKTLRWVVNLDLSCNDLPGSIPHELTNLSRLIALNLSHNHLSGNIPKKIGEMISLESLNLSNNNLSSTIPPSISKLTLMIHLNLSYNQLHKKIPTGHQLQVIENKSMAYIGNLGLCGDPLINMCNPSSHAENQPTLGQEEVDKEDHWEKPLFYFLVFAGFATGFWGIVGSLLLKTRFRFALFHLVGSVTDYFYV